MRTRLHPCPRRQRLTRVVTRLQMGNMLLVTVPALSCDGCRRGDAPKSVPRRPQWLRDLRSKRLVLHLTLSCSRFPILKTTSVPLAGACALSILIRYCTRTRAHTYAVHTHTHPSPHFPHDDLVLTCTLQIKLKKKLRLWRSFCADDRTHAHPLERKPTK